MELPERVFLLVRILVGILIYLAAFPVFADIHGTLTGATNYVYRGYSKTDNNFALQGNLDYQHSSGIYLGTSVSNVNFGDRHDYADSATVEITPYFGYTHQLADDWRVDVQWTRYLYDGKIFGFQSDYNEFYLFLHYRDLLTLRSAVSDSYYGHHAVTGDFEFTARYPLTDYLEISSGLGYSRVQKVLEYDYLYWNAGITARYKFVSADLRYIQAKSVTKEIETNKRATIFRES
jgi:uncharacterized protein (TIGR02001 family)